MEGSKKDFVKNYAPYQSYKIELLNERTQLCFINLDTADPKTVQISLNFQKTRGKGLSKTMQYGQKLYDFSISLEEFTRYVNYSVLSTYESMKSSNRYLFFWVFVKFIVMGLYLAFSFLAIRNLYSGTTTKGII